MLLSPGRRRLPSTFRAGVTTRVELDNGASDDFKYDKEISPPDFLDRPTNVKNSGIQRTFRFGTARSKPEISSYRELIPSWKLRFIAPP
jgi:hypothetical protein